MIAAVIRWSARNIFLVGLASVFIGLAGIYALKHVPLDAIPDLSDVQVIIYTEYPGQAPQVVHFLDGDGAGKGQEPPRVFRSSGFTIKGTA